jgi:peroxiredoxin Q/BCP
VNRSRTRRPNALPRPFHGYSLGRIFSLIPLFLGMIFAGSGSSAQTAVAVGDAAPDFRLQDQNGQWHTLEQYRGTWVALYFYPKDDTPGCTTEACAFRDNIFAFEEIGATIVGVSLDTVASHEAFAEKYSLPFSLLADADGNTAKAYGVLKSLGTFRFAKRQSFLISPDGNIARRYEKVNPDVHSEEVLADLKSLMSADPVSDAD